MPSDKPVSLRAQAEFASFQAFIACYLREVQAGQWWTKSEWLAQHDMVPEGDHIILLSVANPHTELALDVGYRSVCGRHSIVRAFRKQGKHWQIESLWSVLLFLVRDLYKHQSHKRKQLELTWRLSDSFQNIERYLSYWQTREHDKTVNDFLLSEQALPFGHWMHPTPKSRQGCTDWQQAQYSPEFQGCFQLHLFLIERSLISQDSALEKNCEHILAELFSRPVGKSFCLIPVHPLQAQWLLAQNTMQHLIATGKIKNLGLDGPHFFATSSMRTVYHPALPWMLKLSIPVKLTNSLRQNKLHELEAGVAVSQLFSHLNPEKAFPRLRFIHDPAYINLTTDSEESGFECIVRKNPFVGDDGKVYAIAKLTQAPMHANHNSTLRVLIEAFVQDSKFNLREAGLYWFNQYWDCCIETCINLFDRYGIALEAHQQNILLKIEHALPALAWFRDNQGYYLCEENKKSFCHWAPKLTHVREVFFPSEHVIERFCYYLIINQLFAVINRMGADDIVDEATLLRFAVNRLRDHQGRCSERGRALCDYLLHSPTLASKANLLTRVNDIDELEAEHELAIYAKIANPIAAVCNQIDNSLTQSVEREYAC